MKNPIHIFEVEKQHQQQHQHQQQQKTQNNQQIRKMSENSDDDCVEISPLIDFVSESKQLIYENDDITIENALVLNERLQAQLVTLRENLEEMLFKCRKKYEKNEKILSDFTRKVPAGSSKARRTYFFCGYPYFKNRDAFTAPLPADYIHRRKYEMELFPMQLESRTFWTSNTKLRMIQAIRKQVMHFLSVKNKDRIRNILSMDVKNADEEIKNIREESHAFDSKPLAELYEKAVDGNIQIDWFTISARDLNGKHTTNECMGMWFGYLMPTLNRKPWAPSEDDKLLNIANVYAAQNWTEIASHFPNRSPIQCLVQYHTVLAEKNFMKNSRWTTEEDEHLIKMVAKYRIGNIIPWTKILETMPGRYKAQIYNRYMFSLNPSIKREKFTVEEDCILMAAVEEYGSNFQNFPPHLLPGRNFVQIRNRYNNVLKNNGVVKHWTRETDQHLVNLVEKYGDKDWVKIAIEIKYHSRLSCRSRYQTIVNFLTKHPGRTVSDVPRRKKKFSSNVTTSNWMETIIREKQKEQWDEEEEPIVDKEKYNRRLFQYINSELGYDYYNYFKYNYDFHVGERKVIPNSSRYETLRAVAILLHSNLHFDRKLVEITSSIFFNLERIPLIKLEKEYLNFLMEYRENDICLPPNYRTVLALRGLTIMFECRETDALKTIEQPVLSIETNAEQTDKVKTYVKKSKVPQKSINDSSAKFQHTVPVITTVYSLTEKEMAQQSLELFKNRFKMLFYNTALLMNVRCQRPATPSLGEELGTSVDSTLAIISSSTSHNLSNTRKRYAATSTSVSSTATTAQSRDEANDQTTPAKVRRVQNVEPLNIVGGSSSQQNSEQMDANVKMYTVETETGIFRITEVGEKRS